MIQSAQVGAALHRAARIAAPAIALLITSAMLLGRLAYQLGYQLGSAIHARNAQLAALHVRILRLDTKQVSQVRDTPPITINAAVLLREAGLSQRKIAASLGCSRSTVRRQLALASS
jgi:hypothetical protein